MTKFVVLNLQRNEDKEIIAVDVVKLFNSCDYEEAKQLVQENQNYVLIDVE